MNDMKLSLESNKFPTVCTFSKWRSISRDGHPVFRLWDNEEINARPFPGVDNASWEQFDISFAGRLGSVRDHPILSVPADWE